METEVKITAKEMLMILYFLVVIFKTKVMERPKIEQVLFILL